MPSLLSLSIALLLSSSANPYLDRGRELYGAVRYEAAEAQLRLARKVPTNTPAERWESADLLARALAAQGKQTEARRVYAELLVEDPWAPPPQNVSPKIRELFDEAKRDTYPPEYVRIEELPAPTGSLRLSVVDPWRVVESLRIVMPSDQGAGKQEMRRFEREITVALEPSLTGQRAFYVEALKGERVLLQHGTADKPRRAHVQRVAPALSEAPALGLHAQVVSRNSEPSRVPGWALAGIGVASAGVGATLWLSAEQDYARAEDRTRSAREVGALDARYRQKALAGQALLGASLLLTSAAMYFLTR